MLQHDDSAFTEMALQGSHGRYKNDDQLRVRFYMHPRKNEARTLAEGRPIFEDCPYVEIMQPGNKDSIIKRPATPMDKARFADRFRRFEAMQDQEAVEGTPLEQWPGITRAQCEEMKYLNIRTVEQLASVSDSNGQNILGIHALKAKATDYLETAKGEATANALADANAKIEKLESAMQELRASDDQPKKRGRPRKEPVADGEQETETT